MQISIRVGAEDKRTLDGLYNRNAMYVCIKDSIYIKAFDSE